MILTFAQTLQAQQEIIPELKAVKNDRDVAEILNEHYFDMLDKKILKYFGVSKEMQERLSWKFCRMLVFQVCADVEAARLREEIHKAGLSKEMKHYLDSLRSYKTTYYKSIELILQDAITGLLDQTDWLCDNIVKPYTIALRKSCQGLVSYQQLRHQDVMTSAYMAEMMAKYANIYTIKLAECELKGCPVETIKFFMNARYNNMAKLLMTIRKKLEESCGVADLQNARKLNDAYIAWIECISSIDQDEIREAEKAAGNEKEP